MNWQLQKQLSDYSVPPVLSYVWKKMAVTDLEKSLKAWERKVAIAEVSEAGLGVQEPRCVPTGRCVPVEPHLPAHLQPPWGPECLLLAHQEPCESFCGGFTGAWQSRRLFLFTEQRLLPTRRMEAEF